MLHRFASSKVRSSRSKLRSIGLLAVLSMLMLQLSPLPVTHAATPTLSWTKCDVCPETPEVSADGNTVVMGTADRPESGTMNSSMHSEAAALPSGGSYSITFNYDLSSWDSYNAPGSSNAPYNGGTGYYDSFSVSVSQRPYWQLGLTDPLNTTDLPGLGFVWGATSYGDGQIEHTSGTKTVTVPGDPTKTNYLNVTLDTASQPQSNHAYPSWGTITITDVTPIPPQSGLNLTADQPSIGASPRSVPVSDVPTQPSAPSQQASAPLRDISIIGSPLRDISIIGSGLTGGALSTMVLSDLPLKPDLPRLVGNWEDDVLAGSALAAATLSNITVKDVVTLNPPGLAKVTVKDIDFSASRLGSISAAGWMLGNVRARDITLPAGPTFCQRWEAQGFANCGSGFGGMDASLFAQELAGVDVSGFPLSGLAMSNINLTRSMMLDFLLAGDPAHPGLDSSVGLRNMPLGSIRLGELQTAGRLASIVDCTKVLPGDCDANSTKNLAGAAASGAILANAKVRDLGVLNTSTNVWSSPVASFNAFSLGEVVYGILGAASTPIEDVPLQDLSRYSGPTANAVQYHLSYAYPGTSSYSTPVAAVTLPATSSYIPGSAQIKNASAGVPSPLGDPSIDGNVLRWTLTQTSISMGSFFQIDFQARPGWKLGTFSAAATLTAAPDLSESISGRAAVNVVENFESNDSIASATPMAADNVYFTHISRPGDVDLFKLPVPVGPSGKSVAGTRVRFMLSHLPVDADLVVYLPANSGPAQSLAGSPLRDISIIGSPLRDISIIGSPLSDPGLNVNSSTQPSQPQVAQDVPLQSGLAVAGISASRSLNEEEVDVTVPVGLTSDDYFLVQANGYLSASSDQPAVLRAQVIDPAPQPPCAPTTFAFPNQTAAGVANNIVTQGTKTIVLVNKKRFGDSYGSTAANNVANALSDPAFINRSDVMGQVINLDRNDTPNEVALQQAYTAWDQDPCDPEKANTVTRSINALVRGLIPNGTNSLESMVIAGTDRIVPQARIPDLNTYFNELDYTQEAAFTTRTDGGAKNNAFYASFADSYVMSDAPYADFNPVPWLGYYHYVPDLAIGRLGETESQIVGGISRFKNANGILQLGTTQSSGYDFMSDMATSLQQILGGPTTLINDTWTASQLKPIFGTGRVISPNGHANHTKILSANGDANKNLAETLSTADLSTTDLSGSLIFAMGCNLGANPEDVLLTSPTVDQARRLNDWAQFTASKGAVGLVANYGHGYGGKYTIAASERLMVLFAQNLKNGYSTGKALEFAKNTYFGEQDLYDPVQKKSSEELTLWGLPMWHLDVAPTTPASTPPVVMNDPDTSLQAASIDLNPSYSSTTTPDGTILQADNQQPQEALYQPIAARTGQDATVNGMVAKGVYITGGTYQTLTGFDPVISVPVVDEARFAPEPQFDDLSTPIAANVSSFLTPQGLRQRLNVLTTQFRSSGLSNGHVIGTMRKFTSLNTRVFYLSSSTSDNLAAIFNRVEGTVSGTPGNYVATFEVELRDETPSDHTDIAGASILLSEGGTLRYIKLTQLPGTDRFRGSAAASSPSLKFSAQAVDNHGNVSRSYNKSSEFGDSNPPKITIDSPINGTVLTLGQTVNASYSCSDVESPIDSCVGTVSPSTAIDTSKPGKNIFQVKAADAAGNVTIKDAVYYVHSLFDGFKTPVTGTDSTSGQINTVQGGQAVPLKWFLRDQSGKSYDGLKQSDLGLEWRAIGCDSNRTESLLSDPTVISLGIGLKYDSVSGQYLDVVDTPKTGWSGLCRRLLVTFNGVETHFVDFKFK
ncbi:MAG: PxKF domain-containing protein [Actinomycetota bacterium]